MNNNVIKFKLKEKLKRKRKIKIKYYIATYKAPSRQIQGFSINKKEFLKDCVSLTKHMLNERKPEYFFTCIKKNLKKNKGTK